MSGDPFKPKALAWDRESKLLATSGDATVTGGSSRAKGAKAPGRIQLRSHQGVCTRLAFSLDSGLLASGSQDTSVLIWDPRRGKQPIAYAFLDDEVTALRWQPEHRSLLGGDASGNVCLWRAS
jgi:WD40 repeat protein